MLILVLNPDVVLMALFRRSLKAATQGVQCSLAGLMIPEVNYLLLEQADFVSKVPVLVDEPGNFLGHFAELVVTCCCPVQF